MKQLESDQRGHQSLLLLVEVGSTKEKTPGRGLRCCFVVKYPGAVQLLPFLSSYLAFVFRVWSCCSSAGKYLLSYS